MTQEEASKNLQKWGIAALLVFGTLIASIIYGLAHAKRHATLLTAFAIVFVPCILAVWLNKSGHDGILAPKEKTPVTNLRSLLRNYPTLVFALPLLLVGIPSGILLASFFAKGHEEYRAWIKRHTVIITLWIEMPVLVFAFIAVRQHNTGVGVYVALCIIYGTVFTATAGLQLENGVVKFFGTHKAQGSPLVIISMALLCCLAFAVLHYALWLRVPSEYVGLHGVADSIYFSVVTMATVGYGDILPVGRLARSITVAEIASGILLLVVGVSATMTVWLQENQPKRVEASAVVENVQVDKQKNE